MKKIIYIISALFLCMYGSLHAMDYINWLASSVAGIFVNRTQEPRTAALTGGQIQELIAAIRVGNLEQVRQLIDTGRVHVTVNDKHGLAALIWAAYRHFDFEEIGNLLRQADVNICDSDGITVLMDAARLGYTHIVKLLLEAGAGVNIGDNIGDTALMRASAYGHSETVGLLLKNGADVNIHNNLGKTALLQAVCGRSTGHSEIVGLLLQAGAHVNFRDIGGLTPLMWAVRFCHKEMVNLLLQAGADVNFRDINGLTALDIATRHGFNDIIELLNRISDLEQYASTLIAVAQNKISSQHDQKNISANNFSILDLIKYYRPALVECLMLGIIKENHHKKLILDKALMHNDLTMLKALIASEYQIPKIILQKTMRQDIKDFLAKHLATVKTLYLLRSVHEEKPQNTLGLMPEELMRYLVSWLAIDERPASNA